VTTVIDIPLSPYAQKVKLALLEKGIAFDVLYPDVDAPDVQTQMHNPRAEVPVLIDGKTSIFQASIILEYIEERWPEPALRASGCCKRSATPPTMRSTGA
jgi:glutathione S-transferase